MHIQSAILPRTVNSIDRKACAGAQIRVASSKTSVERGYSTTASGLLAPSMASDNEGDFFYYFAYGSNLLKERLLMANPSARFHCRGRLKVIVLGAKQNGLPEFYIKRLEAIEVNDNKEPTILEDIPIGLVTQWSCGSDGRDLRWQSEEAPNGFIPRLHTSHMEKGVYRTIGKMMSTIMIQGGEPPALLAPCVVDYILTGDVLQVNATPDDVSASELREMLKKVESSTERELEDAVKRCDSWRFEVEGLPNPVNMNTKDTFVKKAALFHVILKSQACLDQLIDGLSYYEVLPLFRQNPCLRIFLDLPKMEKEITADDVAGIFKPQFSALGCPRRLSEEMIVIKFQEFLHSVQESPNGFIPKLSDKKLKNGVYRTIGKMISTMIIQGGEAPEHLAPCVVDYILTGDVLQVNATPDDVSASEIREILKKVEKSSTERELEDAVKRCDSWRFEVEGLPNPVNMNTKDTFVKKAAVFHVILKSQACLDQLIDGLSYYEVLPLFRENPSMRIFLDMPKIKKEFTANDIAAIFKPRYSDFLSYGREGQETLVLKFQEFLQSVQVSQRQRERRHTKKDQEGHQEAESSGRLHLDKERADDRREGAENSSPVSDLTSSDIIKMEELLQAHSKKVITPSYRRIFISRVDVWTTAFRYFHQDSFARHHGLLMVSFACDLHAFEMEPPDCGGPRREFFRRLIKAIFEDSGAFEESPTGFIPKLNASHLENGVYRTIGRMMSTIMIQGGEPPARLAPCVVDYILTGDVLQVNATPDDVSASELREMLKKVETSSTERELEDAVKRCDSWRFEVEGLPNPVNMNTKDTFVKKAALFHVILKSQACLDQLIDGLSYYEVLPLFRENPSLRVFLDFPKIKEEIMANNLFMAFTPQFSDVCSYTNMIQQVMWAMFYDFVLSVQGECKSI
ncbi:G2E3 ligase, partial [Polypterus senegalus]